MRHGKKTQLMRELYLIIWILVCSINASGQTNCDSIFTSEGNNFDNYLVIPQNYNLTYNDLILTDGTNRFKTRIKDALNEGINFAGSCIFLFWGCGTSCQQSAIIDTKTKKVIFGPNAATGFIYYPNSRLLVSNPKDSLADDFILKESEFYIWEDDSLKLLKTQKW